MKAWNYSRTWYHGSPFRLTTIREGSTIIQDRDLARVFSHKPTFVSVSDDGKIKHSGTMPGFLYFVSEDNHPDDVVPHPTSSMVVGKEWLTTRALRVQLIESTRIRGDERLTEEQIVKLRRMLQQGDGVKNPNDAPSQREGVR